MRRPEAASLLLLAGLAACDRDGLTSAELALKVPQQRLESGAARHRGEESFQQYCALCHGERADGQGVRQNLSSRPRDFTDRAWRRRVSPAHVFLAIRNGVPGTAMPAWPVLSDDEIWDLVAFLLDVADR